MHGRYAEYGAGHIGDHLQHRARFQVFFRKLIHRRTEDHKIDPISTRALGDDFSCAPRNHQRLDWHGMRFIEGSDETQSSPAARTFTFALAAWNMKSDQLP